MLEFFRFHFTQTLVFAIYMRVFIRLHLIQTPVLRFAYACDNLLSLDTSLVLALMLVFICFDLTQILVLYLSLG